MVVSSQQGGYLTIPCYYSERPFCLCESIDDRGKWHFRGRGGIQSFFCVSELLGCDLVASKSTDGCGLLAGPLTTLPQYWHANP